MQNKPAKREPTLRDSKDWDGAKLLKNIDDRPGNAEAIVGQVIGKVSVKECRACVNFGGPFFECVIVEGRYDGVCINCHWQSHDKRCSLSLGKP